MKAVIIISGGLDSAVLAYFVKEVRGFSPLLLSFDYGQRHSKELTYAAIIAEKLGAPHKVIRLDMQDLLAGSALTSTTVAVPEGHYSAENMALTVVPNRNAIMLSIAFGYAISTGARAVFTGIHAGDFAVYPDCRIDFVEQLTRALETGNRGFGNPSLDIQAPFVFKSKADIVKLGHELRVPFELTWSCYKGGKLHCGRCGTCVERQEAFYLAGVQDPTVYEDPEFWKTAMENFNRTHHPAK